MKKLFFTKQTLIFLACIALPLSSWGQFNKYRSKGTLGSANEDGTVNIGGSDDNASEEELGRTGDEIKGTVPPKSDKYVMLNPETAFGPEVITSFDFPNISLTDLTKHMQKLTGINLILDKELKGKISIVAPVPITVGDAWKAYLAALNINNYSVVKSGAFYKIVGTRDIRYTPTEIYTGTYTPNTENYIMKIVPLKNISAAEIVKSFRQFTSRYGRLIEISQTNTLIIQDMGTNINRLMSLIKFIDVPGHEESLQIIKVKNSSAQEIATLLEKIQGQKGGNRFQRMGSQMGIKSGKTSNWGTIIAEPRTNSIITMANASGAQELRELIEKLDVKIMSGRNGQIHVYNLNHRTAEDIAKTLTGLVSDASGKSQSRFSKRNLLDDEPEALFKASVKVTADKKNNALVITASPTDYLTIKEVIAKLDTPQDQVFVEGLIMESNISKSDAFGINFIGAYGKGGADKAGFTGGSTGLMDLFSNNIAGLGGFFAGGSTGPTHDLKINGADVPVKTINGLITAIATNSDANILSTPQLLITNNTEGVFEVGETVPVPVSATGANGTTQTTIQEKKVTLTLKITPQINRTSRFVQLKINQKVDDFSEKKLTSADGVGTVTRSAITEVNVRDRDTIVMGGLMRDKETYKLSKVPLLGDIPVLGWLFKNKQKSKMKVNILFFLTPRIMDQYAKDSSEVLKDSINRRSAHLKNIYGEDDPFKPTVKGLYEKGAQQGVAPLYDTSSAVQGNDSTISTPTPAEEQVDEETEQPESIDSASTLDKPDYKQVIQEIESKKAGVKR